MSTKGLVVLGLAALARPVAAGTLFMPTPSGQSPFADFDAGNHSYALTYIAVMSGLQSYCNGRTNNAPAGLYHYIETQCAHLGAFGQPATRAMGQQLISTQFYDCGQDFILTDAIDGNDAMQNCIANISNYRSTSAGQSPQASSSGHRLGVQVGLGLAAAVAVTVALA